MAVLTVQNMSNIGSRTGALNPTLAAVGTVSGDSFANDGHTVLLFQNTSGAAITVTLVGATDSNGRNDSETFSVGTASQVSVLGPFPRALFNVGGALSMTYSATGSLAVAAVSLLNLPA